eukprot:4649146-Pyramimonas_sp.AAC.1
MWDSFPEILQGDGNFNVESPWSSHIWTESPREDLEKLMQEYQCTVHATRQHDRSVPPCSTSGGAGLSHQEAHDVQKPSEATRHQQILQ